MKQEYLIGLCIAIAIVFIYMFMMSSKMSSIIDTSPPIKKEILRSPIIAYDGTSLAKGWTSSGAFQPGIGNSGLHNRLLIQGNNMWFNYSAPTTLKKGTYELHYGTETEHNRGIATYQIKVGNLNYQTIRTHDCYQSQSTGIEQFIDTFEVKTDDSSFDFKCLTTGKNPMANGDIVGIIQSFALYQTS